MEQGYRAEISLDVRRVLSYAMAHNRIPVISRIEVRSEVDVQGAVLALDVEDASGAIGAPERLNLDLRAGTPTVLTDLTLTLDPAAMLQVEEQRPGVVRARLEISGEVRAERSADVQVLAANQWTSRPPALALEMLAAYVQPNHPAVTAFMGDVAARLQASTGDPSLQGYQSGPERVDDIVRAVYDAMQSLRIGYAEPPASWADQGQKVRTPSEVLDGRIGTCLDTVVVMAAALEQGGVRPLIWVVEGHAFVGYWREEATLGTAAELDPVGVVNQVDLRRMGVVETTALTARAEPVPFDEARRLPAVTYLTGDLDRLVGVVDVQQARSDRIVPLPARTRDGAGQVTVTEYRPAARTTVPLPASGPGRAAPSGRPEPPRITRWKNALLDLSLRNRLINFTERAALSVVVADGELGVLEDLLHQDLPITLRAQDEIASVDRARGLRSARLLPQDQLSELLRTKRTVHIGVSGEAYASKLRALAHKARTVLEETGANNLYLALGTLVWDLDGRTLRSPLILVPVTLAPAGRGGHYRLVLDEAGASTPNYCLIEKLRQSHGLDLPGLVDPPTDSAGIDLDAAFDAIRATIAERGLHFRVEPTADLSLLQFAKFRLWKDLDESWPAFAENPLVAHLVHTPTEAFADPVPAPTSRDLDGLDERSPVPADSSQLLAIADAVEGRTFVLEGPPGTGKSQTITNLLAHAVAEGRRVLFVAEKRAALDVVQKRLDAVGLGPLSLDLHDKGSKPAVVREQITVALDLAVPADVAGHEAKVEEVRAARRGRTRYAHRLHETNSAGLSLYSARGAVLSHDGAGAPLRVSADLLIRNDRGEIDRLRGLFSALPDLTDAARPGPAHPWAFVDAVDRIDAAAAWEAARALDAVIGALPGALGPALAAVRTPQDLQVLGAVVADLVPLDVLDEVRSPRWSQAVDRLFADIDAFVAAQHPGLDVVEPRVTDLPIGEIDDSARAAAASGFFGRKKRLAAVRDRLAPVLRDGVGVRPKALPGLTANLVTFGTEVERLAGQVRVIPGLAAAPGWNPFDDGAVEALRQRVEWLRWAAGTVDPGHSDPARARFAEPLRAALRAGFGADARPVHETARRLADLAAACGVGPTELTGWAGEQGLLGRWRSTAAARALSDPQAGSLRRWLDLLGHVEPLRSVGLGDTRTAVLQGRTDPDDARRAFEHGIAEAALQERWEGTGLTDFDAAAHERGIARFTGAANAAREQLTTIIPNRVLSRRGFDPTAAAGQVGNLRRQLGVRRGGMKVRELMTTYGDLITRVLPCVLVSPDSLARFFPARPGLFDIVVFDEASQVRVADAVGAMGRGRSVVVVGDSKQMPPTSFAESAFDADDPADAAETVEDEESILTECVQARVERHRLTWHYRSRDEALIAFSNQHYYRGSLSSFPAPVGSASAVSLVRVDGHFHRSGPRTTLRTNPQEAEAVVAEIRRRFDASPGALPSVGVVTFNQQQRAFVDGKLRDLDDPRITEALDDPEGLFVKNLENVQGDERDVILFSTAFSVNDKGALPLNFGPLNRAGGERRLNVAVTRARRAVMVFSSFDPAWMRTEETSSVGLKHLRTYLEMAAHGPSVLPQDTSRPNPPDRHREQIAEALRARGLIVRTDVGLSDFRLDLVLADAVEPDRPLVAVLLDGPAWAKRLTVRDRDALPAEVLVGALGWPRVERIWLPDWLVDADSVATRLVAAVVEAARGAAPELPVVPEESPATRVVIDETSADPEPAPLRGMSTTPVAAPGPPTAPPPFRPWAPRRFGHVDVLDELPARHAARQVAEALIEVVEAEGPVTLDRLAKLVANGFGLNRVAESRKAAILGQLPKAIRRDRDEAVAWPAGVDPAGWRGYRPTPDGVDRPIEQVPLREIGNAMVVLAEASAGIDREELHREALRVFGLRRRTAAASARLDEALSLVVRAGRVAFDGALIVSGRDEGSGRPPPPRPA